MRVLVACEFSGIVRDAFAARGHDAWSCDLLPTERPGQHIQGDVLAVLGEGWDLMVAHPPCTYLSNAGIGWFNEEKYGDRARDRKRLRFEAFEFFMACYTAPIEKVICENPVGYLNSHFRKPDQIIQPYYFGEPALKTTCLWFRGVSPLTYTTGYEKPSPITVQYRRGTACHLAGQIKNRYFTDAVATGPNRAHIRSKTFQGIADAMASQWG